MKTPSTPPPSTLSSMDRFSKLPGIGWFFRKGFLQGAFWAVLIALSTALNDVFIRCLGENLPVIEVVFFRFLIGTILIIPLLSTRGFVLLKTTRPTLHVLRAILGVGAFFADAYGLSLLSLNENTILMASQPLFFLIFAIPFLGERVGSARWIATFIGFLGIVVIIQPGIGTFMSNAFIPLIGAMQFALLDILAKKMVATENSYNMLFYFGFGTVVCSFIPMLYVWQTPTLVDIGFLILLGVGSNFVQICLIRAFAATDASALMPFKYLTILFAIIFGFTLFAEIPTLITLMGGALIVMGTFFIGYVESRRDAHEP